MKFNFYKYRQILFLLGLSILSCQFSLAQGTITFSSGYTKEAYIGSANATFSTGGGHTYKFNFNNAASTGNINNNSTNFKLTGDADGGDELGITSGTTQGNNGGDKLIISDNDGSSSFKLTSFKFNDFSPNAPSTYTIKAFNGASQVGSDLTFSNGTFSFQTVTLNSSFDNVTRVEITTSDPTGMYCFFDDVVIATAVGSTPTTQSTNVLFGSTTTTGTSISWTSGNGSKRAVFVKQASSGTPVPVDNTTYAASTTFGAGDQIGASGWYCVYNGTGTSVSVSGLTATTTYRVMVVEYNGSSGSEAYFGSTGTGNPANVTSAGIPTITSFTPTSAAVGATVTITGTNFNTTASNNIVFFGATKATVTASTATTLTVTVPAGASYAPVTELNTGSGLATYSRQFFTPTFSPNKGAITSADFAAKVDFTVGTTPKSIAIGDIDGDGKPDLVVANIGSNSVSVLRNTGSSGTPGFATKVDFTTGSNPFSVAIGDLDGDGKLDVAVANSSSTSVSVFRNTGSSGTITFAAKVDLTTGSTPTSVAIGDLDGDGRPDLVAANSGATNVSVLRNTGSSGTISFAAKTDFTTGDQPKSVVIGDLDGDDKLDLAVTHIFAGSTSISVLRNTGSVGSVNFAAKVEITTGNTPISVALGDLDGDGKLDMAVANQTDNTVSVLRNTGSSGTISFATKVDFTTGTEPINVSLGDLDGDGKPDLVSANFSGGTVSVLRNTGSSGTVSFDTKADFTPGASPFLAGVGDVDGDGKADLSVVNQDGASISVLRNNPLSNNADLTSLTTSAGTFSPTFSAGTLSYTASVINGTVTATVTPTRSQANASIQVRVNGGSYATVTSGTASASLSLTVGTNTIDITVTAQDGTTTKTYTVTVTRAVLNTLDNAGLTAGTLAASAYSLRKLSTTYTGNAIQVRRSSDDATQNIGFDVGGNLDTASLKTFVGAGNGFVITWYDQSGNARDLAQAITTKQPVIVNAGSIYRRNGSPTIFHDATDDGLDYSADYLASLPLSVNIVAGSFSNTNAFKRAVQGKTSNWLIGPYDNKHSWYASGFNHQISTPWSTNSVEYFTVIEPSSNPNTSWRNGVSQTSANNKGTPGRLVTGGVGNFNEPLNGFISEILSFNSELSNTERQALESNQNSFYPVPSTNLTALTTSAGTITPTFSAATIAYTATVINATTTATVTPTKSDPNATIQVRVNSGVYTTVTSGTASPLLSLNVGVNTIDITVTVQDGTASKTYSIAVTRAMPPPPTITSFTPTSAIVGATVTITGTNFNTTASNNIVFFGATRAAVTASTATTITATVPAGATHAPITVLNTGISLAGYSLTNFNPVYTPAKSGIIATDFEPKLNFATGSGPYAVAIGDLDGDGKSDLVVANSGSNTISVFRNTATSGSIATGSFAAKVDFTTGTYPWAVAIGDVDGDGKLDIVSGNPNSSDVSVFRNTSTSGSITSGSFAAKVDFATGGSSAVGIRDLDGDGMPEIVTSNGNGTVSVLRNTSSTGSITSGSFAAKVDFSNTTGSQSDAFVMGDLDGDGKPDIATANYSAASLSVFRNTSTSGSITSGSFATAVVITTGAGPQGIGIGDIDGDGKLDLLTANRTPSTVSVLRNTATSGSITSGSFAAKVDFATGSTPDMLTVGDLDGDGKPDLVVNGLGGSVSVLRNTSTSGSITTGSLAAKVDFTTEGNALHVAVGDLDGDGKPDLAVANYNTNSLSVLRNADIVFPPTITSFTPTSAVVGATVTITGTNFNTTPANNIVFFGATRATVSASTATSITATVPTGATFAPITVLNTGISLAAYSLANFNPIYAPAKTNITSIDFQAAQDFTVGTFPYSVAISDLDGDGKPDLAVANWLSASLASVLRNTGTSGSISAGSFAAKLDITVGGSPLSAAIGDLDGDGKPDLVVANSGSSTVSVFRNISTSGSLTAGSFAAKVDFATGSGPYSVAIGDLDGDGKPDLAVANNGSGTVSILRNTSSVGSISSGSFATNVDFTVGSSPRLVAIGDLDGDSKPDLVTANSGTTTVSVLRNTSTSGSITVGSFAAKVDFTAGGNPFSVAIGDLDADGKPDLAVANFDAASVSIMRNTSTSGSITAGSFAAKVDFTTAGSPHSVAIGDLDGDGRPDVATAVGSGASVLRNTSTSGSITSGSFAAKVDFASTSTSRFIAIGDMDGDGRLDLVVANSTGTSLSVLRNADPLSTDANLSALAISNGTLSPSFAGATTSYTATVSNTVTSITLTPTRNEATATIKINGITVTSGASSLPISLVVGSNTISTTVTAGDGTTTKTYIVTVTRSASTDANLSALAISNGTLSPSFAGATTSYTATVTNTVTSITITPTRNEATATITVNGITVTSGASSLPINLVVGSNTISTTVTAGNGTTIKTYTVTVTRAAAIVNNVITANQTICAGTTPAGLTGSTPTGGDGSYTYSWVSSTTSSSAGFATASGTTNGKDYTPSSLTQPTWFRRDVTSGGSTDNSAVIAITVNPIPVLSPITGVNASLSVTVQAIGGGGSGSGDAGSGGGGGGTSVKILSIGSGQSATITVGAAGIPSGNASGNGGNSSVVFSGTTITAGGGYGGSEGRAGGISTGGSINLTGGAGSSFAGGSSVNGNPGSTSGSYGSAGGGGGMIDAGPDNFTLGGISGGGIAGAGGNGAPQYPLSSLGMPGLNYGGGGGGGGNYSGSGGSGGQGVVVISYSGSPLATGGTITQTGGVTTHTFSNPGSYSFTVLNANSAIIGIGSTLQLADETAGGTWSSLNTGIATTSATGLVTGIAVGTTTITYSISNSNGCTSSQTMSITVVAASSNADLSGLTISTGTLSPSFAGATTSYTATVSNTVTSITLTPTRNEATATITINGITVTSGASSLPISLVAGSNTITITVTAGDGTTTKTYTVTVTRTTLNTLDNAGLTAGTLAASAYSVRKLSSTYTGNAMQVRRSSDNTTQNIGFNVGGNLDTATLKTFVGAGNGFVVTWYDQSGNGRDLAQATTSMQPAIVNAGTIYRKNDRPTIFHDATDDGLDYAGAVYLTSLPLSVNIVAGSNANTVTSRRAVQGRGNTSTNWLIGPYNNQNAWYAEGFNHLIAPSWSTTYAEHFTVIEPLTNPCTSWRNGVSLTSGNSKGTPNRLVTGAAGDYSAEALNGFISEILSFNSELSSTEIQALETNQNAFYPVPSTNLAALTTSAGTITPSFSAATLAYTATVINATTTVTVTPSKADVNATIQVRVNSGAYTTVTSETASPSLSLNVGVNNIDITVTVQDGTSSKTYTIAVTRAPLATPTITSFTPTSAIVGATVTITGTNFNTTPANNIVFFGATRATVVAATSTTLTVLVPGGATYGPVTELNTGNALAGYSNQSFNPVFSPSKSSITSSDLAARVDFTTGTNPRSVVISDVDGDGKPDIIVTNNQANTVSVLRNTGSSGTPGFATKVDFSTGSGSSPILVAAGDIDGDGKPDLVVANTANNTVSVFRNTSTGGTVNFATKVDFTTAAGPYAVAIGDVDGDGKSDLAVTNSSAASVSVFRNAGSSGTISFAAKADFATGITPGGVSIGDLDGDGKPDLAVTNLDNSFVSVLRNTGNSGTISFAAKIDFTTTSGPSSIILGDLDGDGKQDMVVSNTASSSVSVFRNTGSSGTINFATKVDFSTASGPIKSAIVDIDGDGKPDLAVSNNSAFSVSVLRNTGSSGTINFATKVDFTTASNPISVAAGDIDGDGKADLVTANFGASTVSVLRNSSNNADLSSLTTSAGAISPTFAAATLTYSASVSNGTITATVTPTRSDVNATIQVRVNSGAYTTVTGGAASPALSLNVGANTIDITVTAENGTASKTYSVTVTRAAASANADLSALTLSSGTLNPSFAAATVSYTAAVSNTVTSITLTPTRSEGTATIKVNGTTVASGASSLPVSLVVGTNAITTTVTAGDGTTVKNYVLTITRSASSDANLSALAISNGTLSPSFAGATTSYTATVSNTVTSITLTPTRNDGTATIKVNGTTVVSGVSSLPISLALGTNTITTTVTAGDGTTTKNYVLTVTRSASTNANLSALTVSAGTLSPTFATGTVGYSFAVSNATASITVTPTREEATATITVNGNAVTSGAASGNLSLAVGSNTITVAVTAGDGTTTKTYTLTVTRAASSNNNLSALAVSAGFLNPAFAVGTVNYAVAVSNAITSISITPTGQDITSVIKVNGITVTSAASSGSISLTVGSNTITVLVTAADGSAKTYTLTVTRAASSNANLSAIAVSAGTLSPAFASGTNNYAVALSNATASISVTPTGEDVTSLIKVNGNTITSGASSGNISLAVGGNNIIVLVTAADGTANPYIVTVTRAAASASTNANLSALTVSAGTLSPVFASGTVGYAVAVSNATTSIRVTPTREEGTASITVNGINVTSGATSGNLPLTVGNNTITVVVTAGDGTTTKTYTLTVTRAASSNANLSALSLSTGTLSPVFASGTTSYAASVSNATASITVTPTREDATALIAVNGITVTSGTASGNISLTVGSNTITVVVTAGDGSTTKTYTVAVTRAAPSASNNTNLSELTVSAGTLSPTFASGTVGYAFAVSNATASITVTPTREEGTATITVNGTAVTSGAASGSITLTVGSNTITVIVTAGDGSTTKTYTLTVTRAASSNANLSALTLSAGTLSPSFASGTTSYTASVSNATGSITVTPTREEGTATITVNGTAVTSGAASGNLSLSVGSNTITVVVTAGDGSTTKTYTLTVTRTASSNANLSALTLSTGTLSPSFASGTTSYTTSVSNATASITVTPTREDATALIAVNGITVTSGTASGNISLTVGSNTVTVVVIAGDGSTTKTYTVAVTRAAPSASNNANLSALTVSAGTLSPTFASSTTGYAFAVSNATTAITVTPTREDATALIAVNGITVTSGAASGNISLTVGSNTVTVVVTAGDGSTTKTYILTVTRAASSNANLSALTLSAGTLSPSFASGTASYTASVSNATASITVTPTREEATASITVNGTAVTSDAASGNLTLAVGSNTVTVVVSAGDGSTTKTYTLTVTRAASSNANLSALTMSTGTLNPVFASGTVNYTASVSNATASITVTPTREEATALIAVNGITVTSGTVSGNISLTVGSNTINVVVTAGDGTTKTYTITVTRAAALSSNADLSAIAVSPGSLSPAFAAATTAYSIAIPDATSSISLTPTSADVSSVITINGITVVSGSSITVAASDDVTAITIRITAQDGTTIKTYIVTAAKPRTTWTGAQGTGWTNATNWTNGVPDITKLAIIANTASLPIVSTTETVNNIIVNASAGITISGTMQITGVLSNNGTLSGTGITSLTGSASQTISGTGSIANLTINNSSGVSILSGTGNTQSITGILRMTAGSFATNDNLILGSDASGTAAVAPLAAGSSITGNVTAQRWMGAQRGYRGLGHPFNSALALNQLTDNFSISGSGSGFVTGLGYSTSSTSYYDSVATTASAFKKPLSNAPNTSSSLVWTVNRGILALVRGKGTEGLGGTYASTNEPSAFVADATGVLNQGTLADYVLGANAAGSSFNLVGNPYAAPINIKLLKSNGNAALNTNNGAAGVANTIYVYNPYKNAGVSGTPSQEVRGGLDAYTNDGSTDIIIPPFGAFFVQSKAAGNVIKFDENVKAVNSTSLAVMGGGSGPSKLTLTIENSHGSWDDIKIRWDAKAGSAGIDNYDGVKMNNELLDFYSISSDKRKLCIDSRSDSFNTEEIIPLGISTQVQDPSFRIKVSAYDMPSNMRVYLRDKLLGTETPLTKVDDGYAFSITSDETSKGDNRFELAMRFAPVTPTPDATAANDVKITPNPFKDELIIQLGAHAVSATGITHVRLMNMDGRVIKTAEAAPNTSQIKMRVPGLAVGIYIVEVINDSVRTVKQVIKQ